MEFRDRWCVISPWRTDCARVVESYFPVEAVNVFRDGFRCRPDAQQVGIQRIPVGGAGTEALLFINGGPEAFERTGVFQD